GMTALDIGANIGYVTRTLARLVGPAGRVVALEPEPRNFEVLRANAASLANVRCIRVAALQHTGTVTLWMSTENMGDHRTWEQNAGDRAGIDVPCVRVDDLVDDGVQVGVVKIDTQGTDHLAIEGMERVIARSRPTLFVEFWLDALRDRREDPTV